MPVVWKVDPLEELRKHGITSYDLRKDKLLGERTIQRIREGKSVSFEVISRLCELLNCQPGDLLEFTSLSGQSGNRE